MAPFLVSHPRDCNCCALCTFYNQYRRQTPTDAPVVDAFYSVEYSCQQYPDASRLLEGDFLLCSADDEPNWRPILEALDQTTERIFSVQVTVRQCLSPLEGRAYFQGLVQITSRLRTLRIQTMEPVILEPLSRVVKEATVLEVLEMHLDRHDSMLDLGWVARALQHHPSLLELVFTTDEEFASLNKQNPTMNMLGQALLTIPHLSKLTLGCLDTRVPLPFSAETLAALCQPRFGTCLTVLKLQHIELTRSDCQTLAAAFLAAKEYSDKSLHHETRLVSSDESIHNDADDLSDHCFFALDNTATKTPGLLELNLQGCDLSNDASFCEIVSSVQRHPTLQSLHLEETWPVKGNMRSLSGWDDFCRRRRDRTKSVLEVLQENAVLRDVFFTLSEREEEIKHEVDFYLSLNRLGVRRLKNRVSRAVWGQAAIAMAQPQSPHAFSPAMLYFLLRERPDLVVPTDTNYYATSAATTPVDKEGARKQGRSMRQSLSLPRRWRLVLGCFSPKNTRATVLEEPLDNQSVPSTEPTMLLEL